MPRDQKPFSKLMPVTTILTPGERLRVDAAAEGLYSALHRESFDEVLADLRQRRAGAVLISIARYGLQSNARMAAMVREFPRVPAMALLTETQYSTPENLLTLGQLGVRILIDARQPSGWQTLRDILAAEKASDLQRTALGQLSADLPGAPADCWRFLELLFSHSPAIHTVRQLSKHMHILPSSLMSRFFRAHLPPPKRYLSLARLIRAAKLFENPGLSVASVSNYLDYSSPQSFGRHVKTVMNMSPVEFRETYDGMGMLQHFRNEVIIPYTGVLRSFRPAASSPGWVTRHQNQAVRKKA
ncbi:MAG: helix-turn-helix domain-containing protein [Pseudobdellovibrionaceae bacterium]|nr:helix-turn-helix domain-containing protein [Pseudobdellovibrionaceae bacterium]